MSGNCPQVHRSITTYGSSYPAWDGTLRCFLWVHLCCDFHGYDTFESWRWDGKEETNLDEMEYFLPFPPSLWNAFGKQHGIGLREQVLPLNSRGSNLAAAVYRGWWQYLALDWLFSCHVRSISSHLCSHWYPRGWNLWTVWPSSQALWLPLGFSRQKVWRE